MYLKSFNQCESVPSRDFVVRWSCRGWNPLLSFFLIIYRNILNETNFLTSRAHSSRLENFVFYQKKSYFEISNNKTHCCCCKPSHLVSCVIRNQRQIEFFWEKKKDFPVNLPLTHFVRVQFWHNTEKRLENEETDKMWILLKSLRKKIVKCEFGFFQTRTKLPKKSEYCWKEMWVQLTTTTTDFQSSITSTEMQ